MTKGDEDGADNDCDADDDDDNDDAMTTVTMSDGFCLAIRQCKSAI